MKIFLSWSGNTSKAAAREMRDWLRRVDNSFDVWMSDRDIFAGARWTDELRRELDNAQCGIAFVTLSNQTEPWLNFEVGAIAREATSNNCVCPYLLHGMKSAELLPGPLTQFQYKEANQAGTLDLVLSMFHVCNDTKLSEVQIRDSFEKSWPDLEQVLEKLPKEEEAGPRREMSEMVAEVVEKVRGIANKADRLGETLGIYAPFANPNRYWSKLFDSPEYVRVSTGTRVSTGRSAAIENTFQTLPPYEQVRMLIEALEHPNPEVRTSVTQLFLSTHGGRSPSDSH